MTRRAHCWRPPKAAMWAAHIRQPIPSLRRAREKLDRGTPEYRQAVDIIAATTEAAEAARAAQRRRR